MSEHDIVAEWLQASHDDYDSAKYLFDRPHKKALEIICYLCQQSVEKSLKAFLCYHDVTFPKTHDTGFLYNKCVEIENSFSRFQNICEELTIYATETRYPIRIDIDEPTAERLLKQSEDIYIFVSKLLKPQQNEIKDDL